MMTNREQHAESTSRLELPVIAVLSLAIMCAWSMMSWPQFGNTLPAQDANSLNKIVSRASMGLLFLAIPLLRRIRHRAVRHPALAPCTLCAALSVMLRTVALWCSSDLASVLSAAALGVANALFIRLWLIRLSGNNTKTVLVTFLFSTALGNYFYITVMNLASNDNLLTAVILPFLALGLTAAAGRRGLLEAPPDLQPEAQADPRRDASFWCQTGAVILCAVAGGITSLGINGGGSGLSFYVVAPVMLSLGALLVIARAPRDEFLVTMFVLFICVCIVLSLLVPAAGDWCTYLARAGFWTLVVYSYEWFTSRCPGQGPELSLAAEVGVAAIYLTSALGDAIGNTLSGAAAYVAALVTLIIALVLVVIGVISTPHDARVEAPRATAEALEESAGALAEAHCLTPAERATLACLARGYSLKRVSESLSISESMAKYHRHNLYQKLGVASRQELIDLVETTAHNPRA